MPKKSKDKIPSSQKNSPLDSEKLKNLANKMGFETYDEYKAYLKNKRESSRFMQLPKAKEVQPVASEYATAEKSTQTDNELVLGMYTDLVFSTQEAIPDELMTQPVKDDNKGFIKEIIENGQSTASQNTSVQSLQR